VLKVERERARCITQAEELGNATLVVQLLLMNWLRRYRVDHTHTRTQ